MYRRHYFSQNIDKNSQNSWKLSHYVNHEKEHSMCFEDYYDYILTKDFVFNK